MDRHCRGPAIRTTVSEVSLPVVDGHLVAVLDPVCVSRDLDGLLVTQVGLERVVADVELGEVRPGTIESSRANTRGTR